MFAALYSNQCHCGGIYGSGTNAIHPDSYCNINCAGNSSQKCGGSSNRYSMFEVGAEDCELRGK